MKSVALSEAKDKLSALVDEADREHEIIRITRHGRSAAVLMSDRDVAAAQRLLAQAQQYEPTDRDLERYLDAFLTRSAGVLAGATLGSAFFFTGSRSVESIASKAARCFSSVFCGPTALKN